MELAAKYWNNVSLSHIHFAHRLVTLVQPSERSGRAGSVATPGAGLRPWGGARGAGLAGTGLVGGGVWGAAERPARRGRVPDWLRRLPGEPATTKGRSGGGGGGGLEERSWVVLRCARRRRPGLSRAGQWMEGRPGGAGCGVAPALRLAVEGRGRLLGVRGSGAAARWLAGGGRLGRLQSRGRRRRGLGSVLGTPPNGRGEVGSPWR